MLQDRHHTMAIHIYNYILVWISKFGEECMTDNRQLVNIIWIQELMSMTISHKF